MGSEKLTHSPLIFGEPRANDDITVSTKRLWLEAVQWVEGIQPCSHIAGSGEEVSGRLAPGDADNLILMTSVLAMQDEWCKLASEMTRSVPYLDVVTVPDSKMLSVRSESDSADWLLEVHVVQHSALAEMDKEGTAVWRVRLT